MSSFTVILRAVKFTLEEENLLFDSPNYFTAYFLGDFEEGAEGKRELKLNRNPEVFRIIFEYLSGYEIFPLQDGVVPSMSTLALLKNLKKDALFFGLDGLANSVDDQLQGIQSEVKIEHQYKLFVKTLGVGFAPAVTGYPIAVDQVPLYLEHFKRGELGSQARGWLPLDGTDEVIAVWDKRDPILASYAIVRRSL